MKGGIDFSLISKNLSRAGRKCTQGLSDVLYRETFKTHVIQYMKKAPFKVVILSSLEWFRTAAEFQKTWNASCNE